MKDLAISFFIAVKVAVILLLGAGMILGISTAIILALYALTGSENSFFIFVGMVLFGLLWGGVHDMQKSSKK